MEAATLKKKSTGLSKGKLKKTIKNVLCRPASIHWPVTSEENEKDISKCLSKYKVEIPEFQKLKWEVLKNIPKQQRPKQPAIKKPDGLIFGLRHCSEAIQNKDCSGLLVDSEVNPKSIVQPLIETCVTAKVPVICHKHLKDLSLSYFGIKTACLGIKQGCLEEVPKKIAEFAKMYAPKQNTIKTEEGTVKTELQDIKGVESLATEPLDIKATGSIKTEITNYLLKRTSRKSRVFTPPDNMTKEVKKNFLGQDFIEFAGKTDKENTINDRNPKHIYRNMKLKRVTNNPNRVQMGKKRKTAK